MTVLGTNERNPSQLHFYELQESTKPLAGPFITSPASRATAGKLAETFLTITVLHRLRYLATSL